MQSVLMRNNGSVDKIGAARSVNTIIRDKDDLSKRYFVQTKANLAPMGHGIVFSVSENGIEFLEEIEADADELMGRLNTTVFGRPDDRLQEAMDFISEMLADGNRIRIRTAEHHEGRKGKQAQDKLFIQLHNVLLANPA